MFSLWHDSSTGKRPDSNELKRGHTATYHSQLRHTLVNKSQSIVHLDKDSSPIKVPRWTLTNCLTKRWINIQSVWSGGCQNNDQSSRKASSHFWFLILRESASTRPWSNSSPHGMTRVFNFSREKFWMSDNITRCRQMKAITASLPPHSRSEQKPNLNFCRSFQPLV